MTSARTITAKNGNTYELTSYQQYGPNPDSYFHLAIDTNTQELVVLERSRKDSLFQLKDDDMAAACIQKQKTYEASKAIANQFFTEFKKVPELIKFHRNISKNGERLTTTRWLAQFGYTTNSLLGRRLHQWLLNHEQSDIYFSFSKDPTDSSKIRPHNCSLGKGGFATVKRTSDTEVTKIINLDHVVIRHYLMHLTNHDKGKANALWRSFSDEQKEQLRDRAANDFIIPEINLLKEQGKLTGTPYLRKNRSGQHKIYINIIFEGFTLAKREKQKRLLTRQLDQPETITDHSNTLIDNEYQQGIAFFLNLEELHRGDSFLNNTRIAHQDLKENNITIDAEDYPHIIDFGLATRNIFQRKGKIIGCRDYISPVIWRSKLTPIEYDLIAGARCCHYTIDTDSVISESNTRAYYLDNPGNLPAHFFNHLQSNKDNKTIELLDTRKLVKRSGKIYNAYGPLPTSAIEYAAKLSLLRRNPNADTKIIDEASHIKKRTLVALSLARVNASHSIWETVLNSTDNTLLQSINMLDKFDRTLITDASMRDSLDSVTVINKLSNVVTQETEKYQKELGNHSNPKLLKRAAIALSLAGVSSNHCLWQRAIVEDNRRLQKTITSIELSELRNIGNNPAPILKALLIDGLKEGVSLCHSQSQKYHYANNLIPILKESHDLESLSTHLKQAARILSHHNNLFKTRRNAKKPQSYQRAENHFELARELLKFDKQQWDTMLKANGDLKGIQTYKNYRANSAHTLFKRNTKHHIHEPVQNPPWHIVTKQPLRYW